MNFTQMKKMVKNNVIDFTELVLNNYFLLDLDETDAVILIKLHFLRQKKVQIIDTALLADKLSITEPTVLKRLSNLIEKDILVMVLKKGRDGKEYESFHIDNFLKQVLKLDNKIEEELDYNLIETLEQELNRPLKIIEIQMITRWLEEDHYTEEEIIRALNIAITNNKLSISYIDQILLNQVEEDKVIIKKTNLLDDFENIWEE